MKQNSSIPNLFYSTSMYEHQADTNHLRVEVYTHFVASGALSWVGPKFCTKAIFDLSRSTLYPTLGVK